MEDPSPETWNRLRRYASWIRRVSLDQREFLGEDTVRQFRLNAPAGGWCPALRSLRWIISIDTLRYVDLLFSPQLSDVCIYSGPPDSISPALASTISALPASALKTLWIGAEWESSLDTYWAHLKDSFSSVVLCCGPSLVRLSSQTPLSDEAVDHVIRLPHLRTWEVEGPPPSCSASSPKFILPPLKEFTVGAKSARGWLSLFRSLEVRLSATQDVTPLSRMKKSLRRLSVYGHFSAFIIDLSFVFPIQIFQNLGFLHVGVGCSSEGRCIFKLNNDDIAKFAMAMPQLDYLVLGPTCSKNTCATTAACLLPLSVYCVRLSVLDIHFNTTNIVDDLKNISVDPRFQELHSLPRCEVWRLGVPDVPPVLDESGLRTVVDGMRYIFPRLSAFGHGMGTWHELYMKLHGD